ncbi:MAG: PspA/IM30 family protein [Acidibacillus sp.]|uniref:Protein LiaH n=1 Tax=Sulfoacidibacillus ferrooxidans TaxID=2005001 RepID=A0A9X1V9M1_9BACL|nr:PspA/IM30 family protein [Sulfoacidibacillus ferrooxidans]MCI0183245.1 Protein LiaH [Sulfoacidibacillus ferrooxidans]MCY0893777.1 PspA/IM30 family protein [Acidibacillus sp.]
MALFKRIRDITAASVNDILDKAEDPVKMVNQFLRDMESDINEAEGAVAKEIAVEKRFLEQRNEALAIVAKRQEQAEKALVLGNEDLARKALQDKKEQQEKADALGQEYDKAKALSDNLRMKLDEMKNEYQKMKSKREMLVARAEAAKVQTQVNHALNGFNSDSATRGFQRMEERVNVMESQAQASEEMRHQKPSLDDEFKQLGDSEVDDELAALKLKLAQKADA